MIALLYLYLFVAGTMSMGCRKAFDIYTKENSSIHPQIIWGLLFLLTLLWPITLVLNYFAPKKDNP